MGKAIEISDEFASAMQQLSAEASDLLPSNGQEAGAEMSEAAAQLAEILREVRALHGRIDQLETKLARSNEQSAAAAKPNDLAPQFEKLLAHLEAIRASETVNHRLFDSLHEELIGYRDNFLHESLQKPFIRDLVILFDDLAKISTQLNSNDDARSANQSRENLDNAISSLLEILHRLEVAEIEPTDVIDRAVHRVVSVEAAEFPEEDGQIVMRVKRGFTWRDRVLRPEEVIAKRWG